MSTKKVKPSPSPSAVPASSPGSEFAYRRVWEINQLLVPKPHDFISTSRFFVKEGLLVLWDDRKRCKVKRYCFLFNDLFLFTIPKKKGKKFQLLIYMVLRTPSVSVESVDNSSYNAEFRLHARRKSFIFFSDTMEDRKYWVKALEASIKGTHPEEQHTKAIHQQAKEIAKAPVIAPAPSGGGHHHNDDDAEMTIYSSGSGDGSDDDTPPPASKPKKQQAQQSAPPATPATIDFSTANPFASNVAPSPFANTANPFMTGVSRATATLPPLPAYSAPFASTPVPTMTNNPFLTTPAPGQISTTTTFTQVVTTGATSPNPFTTNNPFATAPVVAPAPAWGAPAPVGGNNPFATNGANPFLTQQ